MPTSGSTMTRQRGGVVTAVILGVLLLAAPTSAATCGPSEATIAGAGVAFVGTLTFADPTGNRGTFAVEEVWKGNVPAVAEVTGATGQWTDPSQVGFRFLVLAAASGNGYLVGNGCNVPYLWDVSMIAVRPASAHAPSSPAPGAGLPAPLLILGGVTLLVVLVSAYAFRSTRAPAA